MSDCEIREIGKFQKGDRNEIQRKAYRVDDFRSMPDIVDPLPVAYLLGISDRSVYRLCQNGTFKAVKCGKLWRINRDSVLSYIGVTIDRTECPSTNIN